MISIRKTEFPTLSRWKMDLSSLKPSTCSQKQVAAKVHRRYSVGGSIQHPPPNSCTRPSWTPISAGTTVIRLPLPQWFQMRFSSPLQCLTLWESMGSFWMKKDVFAIDIPKEWRFCSPKNPKFASNYHVHNNSNFHWHYFTFVVKTRKHIQKLQIR